MISVSVANGWEDWRRSARRLIGAKAPPGDIVWACDNRPSLFNEDDLGTPATDLRVPADFLKLAEAVACFDDPGRWALLYRLLYRIVFEDRGLLEIASDDDVAAATRMQKAVNRDVHKFHAFVRFRCAVVDGQELFLAWHEPHHYTVERASPFFMRRFGSMKFSILTPKGCAHWDLHDLTFSPPADPSDLPDDDRTEEFWLEYYRSIFNPFRLKVRAMKSELPMRHWRTLPEAVLIPGLIADAVRGEE